ncbi:hypothetical protein [Dictyobacter halimunensis]|uniref:hypothetical protein n=1 Tax=Dictyobacter halimunensis TaxID=3026934 RepID=UPI0030C6F6D7
MLQRLLSVFGVTLDAQGYFAPLNAGSSGQIRPQPELLRVISATMPTLLPSHAHPPTTPGNMATHRHISNQKQTPLRCHNMPRQRHPMN